MSIKFNISIKTIILDLTKKIGKSKSVSIYTTIKYKATEYTLVCEFEDLFWTFTGLSTEKDNSIIPFSIYDSRLSNKWSEVYKLEEKQLNEI